MDSDIGAFARVVRQDQAAAARLLLASVPSEAVAALVDAIEEAQQAPAGWQINNRHIVDNIADPGRPYPTVVLHEPAVRVDPPRPEIKHMVRSTVWTREARVDER